MEEILNTNIRAHTGLGKAHGMEWAIIIVTKNFLGLADLLLIDVLPGLSRKF